MVLIQWFERGLGQILAPDVNYAAKPDVVDTKSDFWRFVAPDPKFSGTDDDDNDDGKSSAVRRGKGATSADSCSAGAMRVPPASVFQAQQGDDDSGLVACIHCHRLTPTQPVPSKTATSPPLTTPTPTSSATPQESARSSHLSSPAVGSTRQQQQKQQEQQGTVSEVERHVLEAARDWARYRALMANSNNNSTSARDQQALFRFCTTSRPLDERSLNKARIILIQEPLFLTTSRSTNWGQLCPDGCTLLQAAAYQGNVSMVKLLLEVARTASNNQERKILEQTNLQGQTALHLAAEQGEMAVLQVLQERHALLFASASTSSHPQEEDLHDSNTISKSSADLSTPTTGPALSTPETRNMYFSTQYPQSVDLAGRTPFGSAMTSPNPKARQSRLALQQQLFSPVDASVIGSPLPVQNRMLVSFALQLVAGHREMPGLRIVMEDSIACCLLQPDDNSNNKNDSSLHHQAAFFAVCDGHSDGGRVSQFVAEQLQEMYRRQLLVFTGSGTDTIEAQPNQDVSASLPPTSATNMAIWTERCQTMALAVDEALRQQGRRFSGGSTAVSALVTATHVIVANVGDSRCILVQRKANRVGSSGLEDAMHDVSLSEEPSTPTLTREKDNVINSMYASPEASPWQDQYQVIALTRDHKPNLPQERDRIENAGLTIREDFVTTPSPSESATDMDGSETTTTTTTTVYHKIVLSSTDLLACSRAFGDFDYKKNPQLGPEEQAVVAIPDVVIHKRQAEQDVFLILACDGVWDVMSNEDVGQFVVEHAKQQQQQQHEDEEASSSTALTSCFAAIVADALCAEALRRGSEDNISAVIVALSSSSSSTLSPSAAMLVSNPLLSSSSSSTAIGPGKALDFDEPAKKEDSF